MGRLNPFLALGAVVCCLTAADPQPVEQRAAAPGGGQVRLRLVFRQGIQVEAGGLPPAFRETGARPRDGWFAFEDLSPEGRRWVLQTLWPGDVWRKDEVVHQVRWPELESVWLLASLFCAHGQNYDQLQAANPGNPEKLAEGDRWRIPAHLLARYLGGPVRGILERAQPEDELDDEARVAAYRSLLSFGSDAQGAYAAYRLRRGEALYSSVVMRFTDRVDPKEVNELAQVLARRSGIEDVRSIPAGTLIRIPVAHLAGPFQPEGTQALREEREVRAEIRRTARIDAGPRLRGVRIVLDPGHGGVDVGAMANGVWESDFVYDLTMRVKRILEQDTEAAVSVTLSYPALEERIRERIPAPTREAVLLTTPTVRNDSETSGAVSAHLRWVLANAWFAEFARKGDARRSLFLSFHADSLHPSAQGTMVYVPGASGVPARFALGAARVPRVKEFAAGARVNLSSRERLQGEARSRVFAEGLVKALRSERIPIHANRPIRSVIHRSGRSFVPAVLRHSRAATKALVEVANLTNESDAENLKDPAFRERYAEAVVKGIRAYYGK